MDNTGVGGVQIDLFLGKGFTDGALMGHSPSESSCRVPLCIFCGGLLFGWCVGEVSQGEWEHSATIG